MDPTSLTHYHPQVRVGREEKLKSFNFDVYGNVARATIQVGGEKSHDKGQDPSI